MRSLIVLVILGGLVVSGSAWGQEAQTQFTLLAELRDGAYVWVGQDDERNPTLRVPAGESITVHIQQGETSGSVPHDIMIGGGERSERIVEPGETARVTFTAPPSGTLPYTCTVHPSTMNGEIEITDEGVQESAGDNGVPGAGGAAVLALLACVALALRRRHA